LIPTQYLYNGLARPLDYSIFAREETRKPVSESMLAREQTRPHGQRAWLRPSLLAYGQRHLSCGRAMFTRDKQRNKQGEKMMPRAAGYAACGA